MVTDATTKASIVFLEGEWGQLLIGPYHGVLHGNMAVQQGQRLMITFYCKTTICTCARGQPPWPWEEEDRDAYFGRSRHDAGIKEEMYDSAHPSMRPPLVPHEDDGDSDAWSVVDGASSSDEEQCPSLETNNLEAK